MKNKERDEIDKRKEFENISSLEKTGVKYLLKESHFLKLSVLIPLFVLLVQLINVVFIILFPPPPPQFRPFNLIPLLIMIIISFVIIIHYITVQSWNREIQHYLEFQKLHLEKKSELFEKQRASTSTYSLSKIMYRTIEHIKKFKWSFIAINFIFLFYLYWVVRGFINRSDVHSPPFPLHILNIISQFLLFVYLLLQWNFTLRWIKKEKKLKELEKTIASELEIK
ncbi:MAG: hypothetical protein ACTSVB_08550 [Candidatus Heimdallarchaeaceae archaeon]